MIVLKEIVLNSRNLCFTVFSAILPGFDVKKRQNEKKNIYGSKKLRGLFLPESCGCKMIFLAKE